MSRCCKGLSEDTSSSQMSNTNSNTSAYGGAQMGDNAKLFGAGLLGLLAGYGASKLKKKKGRKRK